MEKIYGRKIALLCAIAVLLAVYILQVVFSARSSVRDVTTDAEIDSLTVANGGNVQFTISKSGDNWLYGERTVYESRATGLVNSVQEIRLLDAVSSGTDDLERYGLNADNVITVTAFSGGNVVRTLQLGKVSTAGAQCYVMLDDDENIYLAQGALRSTFLVNIENILEPEETEDAAEGDAASAGTSATVPET